VSRERPICVTTGKPTQRGKRLKSVDGLAWKERNRASVNARRRELYRQNPERDREKNRTYRKRHPKKVLEYNARWRRKFYGALRAELIAAYGGRCACCGESESIFLDLDHVNNDGKEDRQRRGNSRR
jgi:hypothetical protein